MACTFSQARMTALCTSGVVYAPKGHVHHVYMVKDTTKKPKKAKPFGEEPLAWKKNHIAEHREAADMTQQDMADALAERGIKLGRNSVGRVEQGKQRPPYATLEAMAGILGLDVDSMVNLTPQEAEPMKRFWSLSDAQRRRALRHLEIGQDD